MRCDYCGTHLVSGVNCHNCGAAMAHIDQLDYCQQMVAFGALQLMEVRLMFGLKPLSTICQTRHPSPALPQAAQG